MANRYDPLRQTEQQVEEERAKGTPARGSQEAQQGIPSRPEQQQELDPVDAYIQALPGRVANLEERGYRRNGEIQNIINREDAGTLKMTSLGKEQEESKQESQAKEKAADQAPKAEDARQQKALEMMEAVKAHEEREQAREQGRGEIEGNLALSDALDNEIPADDGNYPKDGGGDVSRLRPVQRVDPLRLAPSREVASGARICLPSVRVPNLRREKFQGASRSPIIAGIERRQSHGGSCWQVRDRV